MADKQSLVISAPPAVFTLAVDALCADSDFTDPDPAAKIEAAKARILAFLGEVIERAAVRDAVAQAHATAQQQARDLIAAVKPLVTITVETSIGK